VYPAQGWGEETMFWHSLRRLAHSVFQGQERIRRGGASSSRRAGVRPGCETLEERILLDGSLDFNPGTSARENAGTALLKVVLSEPNSQTVTVKYAAAGGTARAGVDYKLTPGTLTFLPGQTVQAIPIQVLDDTRPEGNETILVNLS